MYEVFYGLTDEPFKIAPDTKFLYLSKKHDEALERLLYGIERKKGIVVLTGEIGTGKTLLLKALIRRLASHTHTTFLVDSQTSSLDMFRRIFHEFGLKIDEEIKNNFSKDDLSIALRDFLLKDLKKKDYILILDEAQGSSYEVLEQLRLFSNFEFQGEKLIQIVLVGHPELQDKLNLPEFAKLKQRIGVSYRLLPLNARETEIYIEKRLTVAGAVKSLFTAEAIEAIYHYSRGIPRVINILCDLALFLGCSKQQREIDPPLIKEAAASLHVEMPADPRGRSDEQAQDEGMADTIMSQGSERTFPQPSDFSQLSAAGQKKAGWRGSRRLVSLGIAACVLFGSVLVGLSVRRVDFGSMLRINQERISPVATRAFAPLQPVYVRKIAIVQPGDTLQDIILQEYGQFDNRILALVKSINPDVTESAVISAGQKIVLPALP